jgi:hypothetical protein
MLWGAQYILAVARYREEEEEEGTIVVTTV